MQLAGHCPSRRAVGRGNSILATAFAGVVVQKHSFPDFLYARGIQHRRGKRYPDDYAKKSGRARGQSDLHFDASSGTQIDVEIWGGISDTWSRGKYSVTRKKKGVFRKSSGAFWGIIATEMRVDSGFSSVRDSLDFGTMRDGQNSDAAAAAVERVFVCRI